MPETLFTEYGEESSYLTFYLTTATSLNSSTSPGIHHYFSPKTSSPQRPKYPNSGAKIKALEATLAAAKAKTREEKENLQGAQRIADILAGNLAK